MWTRRWYSPEALALQRATGAADPALAIRQLAAALIDEAGFAQPPVHPAILASCQDVHEVRQRPMVSAARLVRDSGRLVIEVNEDHSAGKQNFSTDHEVSHTLLPTYTGYSVDDAATGLFAATSEEELLCDIGAAALLLDERWLRPLGLEAGPSIQTLLTVAELFGASLEATARRLAELDLWSCAFVVWEEGYRKNERIHDGQGLMPGLESYGRPKPELRVKR